MENIEEEKEYERKRIGKRIAEIRKIKGISQAKLAEITGMTPGNIARIELGKYSTGIDILSKIAEGLGYQLDFIKKSVQQIPSDRESWYAYTKIAKNREDADSWMSKFEIVRQGHIPKQVVEECPYGQSHIHIFVTNKKGDDVIICPDCFLEASWEQRIS